MTRPRPPAAATPLSGLLLCGLLLAGCALTAPGRTAPDPAARIAAECRLLEMAAAQMAARGTPAHEGLREGCPGVATRDTRPLARQSQSLRAANAAALPAGIAPGSRAEVVFRRMITRGVPPDIAAALTPTPEFRRAALEG